jgi:hypothetical protein
MLLLALDLDGINSTRRSKEEGLLKSPTKKKKCNKKGEKNGKKEKGKTDIARSSISSLFGENHFPRNNEASLTWRSLLSLYTQPFPHRSYWPVHLRVHNRFQSNSFGLFHGAYSELQADVVRGPHESFGPEDTW